MKKLFNMKLFESGLVVKHFKLSENGSMDDICALILLASLPNS